MSAGVVDAPDEVDEYVRFRFDEARSVGLTLVEASLFATGDQPLQLLWRLAADGCEGRLLARIVV